MVDQEARYENVFQKAKSQEEGAAGPKRGQQRNTVLQ
jgi:hypothetical protein